MLQKLNERIQGVIAWLVIILIALTFTLFGVDYYIQSRQTSDAKVLVNNEAISQQVFETNYRRARAQQDLSQTTAADEKNLQNQVLNQLITNKVTIQSAHHYGFDVTPEQANAAIVQIPQFQQDGHFSSERYQQALSAALFTPETFQKEVKQGMLLNQQRFAFMGSSFALPAEIERFVRLYLQTRNYEYLIIPQAAFEKKMQVSEEGIKDYYQKNKKEFMTPEELIIEYVTLSMPDIRAKIKVSEEDIQHYYEENKSNYLKPAQWEVAHILFSIPENASEEQLEQIHRKAEQASADLQKKPEEFNQLMKKESDDKLSLVKQGVLPLITAGQNEYGRYLSDLKNPGQISAAIKTKHGYEIFKLIKYTPVKTLSLAEVNATIKEQLLADKAQNQYTKDLESLTDLSYQSPDSLQSAAEALGLPIQKSEPFSHAGGKSPITQNKQVIQAAFSNDVLSLGNNSEPLQIDNNSVMVLRVNKHIPAQQQDLSLVHQQIEQLLAKRLAQNEIKKIGDSLLKTSSSKQAELLNLYHLKWSKVEKAARDSESSNAALNDLAFNLLKPNEIQGITLDNGDYALVKLISINDGQIESVDQEHRNSLIQQIESSYGVLDYELYVKQLMSQAKIDKP